jgi:UDP-N-acetylmuramoylalanine--D-glutamate ligase
MSRWNGKKILMIGAARQGLALTRFLAEKGADVILNDRRPEEALVQAQQELADLDITWVLGEHPPEILDKVDLVCLSGGIPLDLPIVQEARQRGINLSNDSQIFLEEVPCPVIGITGSAGKTTTTALVGEIAHRHYAIRKPDHQVWVGGNIGYPLIQEVDKMQPDDLAVVEFSSFQLELMNLSPHIAAVLNITPNHLDRHKTMSAYTAAKANILSHQGAEDIAILNRDDPRVRNLYREVKGRMLTFGMNPPHNKQDSTYFKRGRLFLQASGQVAKIMKADMVNLRGTHNIYNVLAAIAISAAAQFSLQAIYEGILEFEGVPHRLEFVREWGGASWYNDSIATAPERTIAAINAFDNPLILLAGGRDKDLPWDGLAQLIRQRVDHLVLFGEAAGLIAEAVGQTSAGERPYSIDRCEGLEEAVQKAAERVEPGDIVLLSPGGTSFDAFVDFEERGKRFMQWVKALS